jgi:hypothetical protein
VKYLFDAARLAFMRTTLLLSLGGALLAQDPREIIRKSVERDLTNFERARNYTFIQRAEEREIDGKGNVKKTDIETHEIIFLAGRPYEKLISRDDKPLDSKEARKEEEKMEKELKRRQRESDKEQKKFDKDRAESRRFLREVPEAYNFRLMGEEQISGQDAWVIEAEPKPKFKPAESKAKLLSKIRARLWIGKSDYQWVKVDAEATDTISFGGFLLRIAPGAHLQFEQTHVNDEVWLPKSVRISAQARLALLKKMRGEISVTFSDYKKFQADSRILTAQ